jgi:hypothetical protein
MERDSDRPLLNTLYDLAKGTATGICEVSVNQPLITLKNMLQCNKGLRGLRLSSLYRGYITNVASMGPITAAQEMVKGLLSRGVSQSGPWLDMGTSFVAGAASAVISAPSELLILQQQLQLQKKGLSSTAQWLLHTYGYRKFFTGVIPTAMRDGIFTVGYQSLAPLSSKMLGVSTGSPFVDTTIGGLPAGLLATIVSHPFDTIKTLLQAAPGQNLLDKFAMLKKQQGIAALYKGVVPRGTRIMLAIPLMSYVRSLLEGSLK